CQSVRFCLLVLSATALYPQEFRGTLAGVITDPQGSVVPGAKIRATQLETGSKNEAAADSEGRYTLPFLTPGSYKLEIDAPGFKRTVREGLRIGANERVAADITLEIGQAAETVTVSAEAPLLTTSTASTGQVINQQQVENMPINGRTPLVLAQL